MYVKKSHSPISCRPCAGDAATATGSKSGTDSDSDSSSDSDSDSIDKPCAGALRGKSTLHTLSVASCGLTGHTHALQRLLSCRHAGVWLHGTPPLDPTPLITPLLIYHAPLITPLLTTPHPLTTPPLAPPHCQSLSLHDLTLCKLFPRSSS